MGLLMPVISVDLRIKWKDHIEVLQKASEKFMVVLCNTSKRATSLTSIDESL